MNDNFISIGGFILHEPTTVITDLIITILCYLFFYLINKEKQIKKNWAAFFLSFGISTFLGAFSHGLFAIHEGIGYKSFWLAMQITNVLSVYFAQIATNFYFNRTTGTHSFLKKLYLTQFFVSIIAVLCFQNFLVVIINNALGLLPIMIETIIDKQKRIASMWISSAIAISISTAIVHGMKISFHVFFNHNDISHIIMMLSLSIIFIGVHKKIEN